MTAYYKICVLSRCIALRLFLLLSELLGEWQKRISVYSYTPRADICWVNTEGKLEVICLTYLKVG